MTEMKWSEITAKSDNVLDITNLPTDTPMQVQDAVKAYQEHFRAALKLQADIYEEDAEPCIIPGWNTYHLKSKFEALGGVSTDINWESKLHRGERGGYWTFPEDIDYRRACALQQETNSLPGQLHVCTGCKQLLPKVCYGRDEKSKHGRKPRCKTCAAAEKQVDSASDSVVRGRGKLRKEISNGGNGGTTLVEPKTLKEFERELARVRDCLLVNERMTQKQQHDLNVLIEAHEMYQRELAQYEQNMMTLQLQYKDAMK